MNLVHTVFGHNKNVSLQTLRNGRSEVAQIQSQRSDSKSYGDTGSYYVMSLIFSATPTRLKSEH